MKSGQKMSDEAKKQLSELFNGKKNKVKIYINFTDKEKFLIKQYCNERINELMKEDEWGVKKDYANKKQLIINKIDEENTIITSTDMLEDLYDMVWNKEYLDYRHTELNLTILAKIEKTEIYRQKNERHYLTQKKYKENQRNKYLRKKNENIYR